MLDTLRAKPNSSLPPPEVSASKPHSHPIQPSLQTYLPGIQLISNDTFEHKISVYSPSPFKPLNPEHYLLSCIVSKSHSILLF
jgi:hypothetical protein